MNFLSDQLSLSRSSHRRCFVRKGVLRNFVKLTGKQLCKSLYFNKVACRLVTLLKKRLRQRCFPVNFAKFLRTSFLIKHLWATASISHSVISCIYLNINNFLLAEVFCNCIWVLLEFFCLKIGAGVVQR